MNILGVSVSDDAAACLVSEGRVLAAVEEERFVGEKHYNGFPINSIDYCLNQLQGGLRDVDVVAIPWIPWEGNLTRVRCSLSGYFKDANRLSAQRDRTNQYFRNARSMLYIRSILKNRYDSPSPPVKYYDHHLSHAALAYYASPFKDSLIITVDGSGERTTVMVSSGVGEEITPLWRKCLPHSLGHLYAAITLYLGFKPLSGEGKTMALAAFGEDKFHDFFAELVNSSRDIFRIDPKIIDYQLARAGVFTERLTDVLGKPRRTEDELEERHFDVASSLQFALERVVGRLVDFGLDKIGSRNLCIAGGVGLNSVMNAKLAALVEGIYVPYAPGDNGACIGAALLAYRKETDPNAVICDCPYLGSEYSNVECEEVIRSCGRKYEVIGNAPATAAKMLNDNKLIGWFRGRMEFGPRALGNRSILADPRKAENKKMLNSKVKHRESFRPFAPSIMAEYLNDYFDYGIDSPYMSFAVSVKEEKRREIPAVLHIDGTARLQSVTRETNPDYYGLIEQFRQLTGVPVLLNTSFNDRGVPIVRTPEEALSMLDSSELDAVFVGDFVVYR